MRVTRAAYLVFLTLTVFSTAIFPQAPRLPTANENRHLLIVLDGLRPDYLTPALMPNVYALGQRGAVFTNHHSVFPSLTTANAAAIATGAYPERNGVLGNNVFLPELDSTRFLPLREDTVTAAHELIEPGLLTARSFMDSLEGEGTKTLAIALLSALSFEEPEGALIRENLAQPERLAATLHEALGPWPERDPPNYARNQYTVDALLEVGLPEIDPMVTFMWLTEPDGSAHEYGVGHPTMISALEHVDAEIGRILGQLSELGILDRYNVWVTSDHGFSNRTDTYELDPLIDRFQGMLADGSPRIVADSGFIYVRDGDREIIREIVAELQKAPTVGAIFTESDSPRSFQGWVSGTLSFDAVRLGHERGPDIFYSSSWSADVNEYGYAGSGGAMNYSYTAAATHGGSGPYDIHNTLIAAGPDIKPGVTVETPTSNVDIAPTILYLNGVESPASMQGRPIYEALIGGPDASGLNVEKTEYVVESPEGYRLTAHFSTVSGYQYFDYTDTTREQPE